MTSTFLVPTAIQSLVQLPASCQADYISLKVLFHGGAPLPSSLYRAAVELLPSATLLNNYGTTETLCVLLSHKDGLVISDRPLDGVQIRVMQNGQEVAADGQSIGELQVLSPFSMKGYIGAAATADGAWYETGDLCTIQQDGSVNICGRVDDMMLVAGEKVFASKVLCS